MIDRNNHNQVKKRIHPDRVRPVKQQTIDIAKETAHSVSIAKKIPTENTISANQHTWFYKRLQKTREQPEAFQLEATSGEYYRLIVGLREPKNRPVARDELHWDTTAIMIKG